MKIMEIKAGKIQINKKIINKNTSFNVFPRCLIYVVDINKLRMNVESEIAWIESDDSVRDEIKEIIDKSIYQDSFGFFIAVDGKKQEVTIELDLHHSTSLYLYVCEKSKNICIYNDIDLECMRKSKGLNKKAFAKLIAYGYQFGEDCQLDGIIRLVPTYKYIISIESCSIKREYSERQRRYLSVASQAFKKNFSDKTESDLHHAFKESIRKIEASKVGRIIFGLSGGHDSRMIAATIKNRKDTLAFTFGPKGSPDVVFSKRIASKLDYKWKKVNFPERYADSEKIRDDIIRLNCNVNPIHMHTLSYVDFINFESKNQEGVVISGFLGDLFYGDSYADLYLSWKKDNFLGALCEKWGYFGSDIIKNAEWLKYEMQQNIHREFQEYIGTDYDFFRLLIFIVVGRNLLANYHTLLNMGVGKVFPFTSENVIDRCFEFRSVMKARQLQEKYLSRDKKIERVPFSSTLTPLVDKYRISAIKNALNLKAHKTIGRKIFAPTEPDYQTVYRNKDFVTMLLRSRDDVVAIGEWLGCTIDKEKLVMLFERNLSGIKQKDYEVILALYSISLFKNKWSKLVDCSNTQ